MRRITNGKTCVTYSYDNSGNLLSEESALKTIKYSYNAQNRFCLCEVTDRENMTFEQSAYAYDAFGTMLKTDSLSAASDSIPVEFGYLGKHLDPTAKLYNYGFRDYSPSSARFTTVDPIRDDTNWFAYCGGDPVNFVDLWGLESGDKSYVDNVVEYFIPDGNGARYKKNRAKTTGIVIHYTAGAYLGKDGKEHAQTPIETINYWIKQESTNAHYVIGENGEIYQAIPKNEIGQHAGNGGIYKIKDGITEKLNGHPNARTIGIEMENIDRKGVISSETEKATIQLTAKLCKEYGLNPQTDIYRHYDITGKPCPKNYVDNEESWQAFKKSVEIEMKKNK